MRANRPVIVIPAYDPDSALLHVIEQLLALDPEQKCYQHIVIVDDGSNSDDIFQQIQQHASVIILRHQHNRGKGAALKTAFNWLLKRDQLNTVGVVTADADGQHVPTDILKVAAALRDDPTPLWLGCRRFDGHAVPLRSFIGNTFSRLVFRHALDLQVSDTQTGLRGIPFALLPSLCESDSDHYEFELDMLIYTKRLGYDIRSVTIETIYEDGNETSHFRPLIDSALIYKKFLKFSGVAIVSALLDYGSFAVIYALTGEIFLGIALARLISGVFNFSMNRQWVFKRGGKLRWDASKYTLLAVALVCANYTLTKSLAWIGLTPFIGKPLAEGLIFLFSYRIQKKYIFK